MKKFKKLKLICCLTFGLSLLSASVGLAAEESLDLEAETTKVVAAAANTQAPKFLLMGRIDLTTETNSPDQKSDREHTLDNNHFLVFLKAKASEKTSFMGEIVKQSFYFVDFAAQSDLHFEFGKIIVPFGDTRRFHHFYGGVQGYKANGAMFPNMWAESGANIRWEFASSELETYWVDSIQDDSTTLDPSLQSAVEPRTIQAGGLRWSTTLFSKLHLILSAYRGEYQPGKAVEIGGFDLYSDYGAFGFSKLRWAFGFANAWLRKAPVSGDFEKRGDFLEVATTAFGPGESRFRYGTYIDNRSLKSQKDTHSFNVGYSLPVDALRILAEYQWNYEAINEKNNDVFRTMVSVDF